MSFLGHSFVQETERKRVHFRAVTIVDIDDTVGREENREMRGEPLV